MKAIGKKIYWSDYMINKEGVYNSCTVDDIIFEWSQVPVVAVIECLNRSEKSELNNDFCFAYFKTI